MSKNFVCHETDKFGFDCLYPEPSLFIFLVLCILFLLKMASPAART